MIEHGSADLAAREVVFRQQGDPDTWVRLCDPYVPCDDDAGTGFAVELRADGLQARVDSVEVCMWGQESPADFLDRLVADFRGWEGERTWHTNHMALRAVFRSGGYVALTWALVPWTPGDDVWGASLTMRLEVGEELSTLAADLRGFLEPES
ncbi:DUF6228 family protein [Streptomyces sp. ME03-5709C]|nr:DUF6228 family protein [Streptomyces sp. ME03-5709C]